MKNSKAKIQSKVAVSLATVMLAGGVFLLSGCGNHSQNEMFNQSELFVSSGEKISLSDLIDSKFNGEIVSSNENIISIQKDSIKFLTSGQAYLYAVKDGKEVGYVKVFVKPAFKVPENIRVDESGRISWNISSVLINDSLKTAKYQLKIKSKDLDEQIIDCQTNFYDLTEKGTFEVSVKAIASELVDESEWSDWVRLNYLVMPVAEGVSFQTDNNSFSTKGRLSWDSVNGAKYNVLINNLLFETENNYLDIDLANIKGQSLPIIIEVLDYDDKKVKSRTSEITIQKLPSPEIKYSDGMFMWEPIEGATAYGVKCVAVGGGVNKTFITEGNITYLEGVEEGVYKLYVQAIGQGEVANSSISEFNNKIVKLGDYNAEITITENGAEIDIESSSNNLKRFVFFNNGVKVGEVQATLDGTIYKAHKDLSLSTAQKYEIYVQALPETEDGQIIPIDGTTDIAASEKKEFTVYKLANISNIEHSLNEEKQSILSFDAVQNADNYIVKINGHILASTVNEVNGKVEINIGVLDRSLLGIFDGENFEIEVIATREDGTSIDSNGIKILKVLSAPTASRISGGYLTGRKYNWSSVLNTTKFRYEYYKTDDDQYSTQGVEKHSVEIEDTKTLDLVEGFYVLKVFSLSPSYNEFLDSEGYLEDNFIISQKIETPEIESFTSQDGNHSISFFANGIEEDENYQRSFEIYIKDGADETLLATAGISQVDGSYVYNFDENFDLTDKSIKIRLVCLDDVDKKIYLPSDFATINVKKLYAPQVEDVVVNDQQVLSFNLRGDALKTKTSYNGIVFEENGEPLQEINLMDLGINFTLKTSYAGYYNYEYNEFNRFTTGDYYIESDNLSMTYLRGLTPVDLKYSNGVYSFDETGPYEKFLVTITVKTQNDTNGKSWDFETVEKSFDAEDLRRIIASDEFNTYYSQKSEITLKVSSFANEFNNISNIYYLPSFNNVTSDNGIAQVTVSPLSSVSNLNYSREENKLVWSSVNPADGTIYEIYLNEEKIGYGSIVDIANGVANYEFNLSGYEFVAGDQYVFTTIAKSENSFDSRLSNRVVIEKVKSIDSVIVSSSIEDKLPSLKWTIAPQDFDKISKIVVNGVDSLITNSSTTIDESVEEYKFKVVARDGYSVGTTKYVFMDSDETSYTLLNAKNVDYVKDSQVLNGAIRWTKYINGNVYDIPFDNFRNSIMYRVYADYNASSVIKRKDLQGEAVENIDEDGKNYIELKDDIFLDIASSAEVDIYAYLNDYVLSKGAKGLYLCEKVSDANLTIERLNTVSNQDYTLEDIQDFANHTMNDEQDRKIVITWDYAQNDVTYEVRYDDNVFETSEKRFEIRQGDLLKNTTVFVRALSSDKVPSQFTSVVINISNQLNAVLNDDGLFNIDTAISDRYLISIDCGSFHKDISTSSNAIDLFDVFKDISSELLSETISIKYAAVGKKDAVLRENEIIEKDLLIKKDYLVKGNKLYFDANFADSVVINYKNSQNEIETIEIANKKSFVRLDGTPLGVDAMLSEVALNKYNVPTNLRTINSYFEFEIPQVFESGKDFNYYYKKSGYINSWFDRELQEDYIASTQETLTEIQDVSLKIENSGAAILTVEENPERIILDVYYSSIAEDYYLGKFSIDGDVFDINFIETLLGQNLKVGDYRVYVKKTKAGLASNEFAYSDDFMFEIKKLENSISNIHVDNRGVLVWNGENSKYVLKQSNLITNVYYNVETKYFDLTTVEGNNKTNFSIANYGNVEFAKTGTSVEVNASEVQNKFVIPSDFIDLELDESDFTADIHSASVGEDAVISVAFDSNLDIEKELNFYFEYNKKIYSVDYQTTDNAYIYKINLVSVYDQIKDDLSGDVTYIDLFATSQGCIKSSMKRVNINIKDEQVTSTQFKAATFDDYISFDLNDLTYVWLRVKDLNGEVLKVAPYEIDNGYLVLQGENSGAYSKALYDEAPSDPNVQIEQIKGVNLTKILEEIDSLSNSYTVEFAPVLTGGSLIKYTAPIGYARLVGINAFKVSGEFVEWTNPESNSEDDYFANRLTSKVNDSDFARVISLSENQISYQEFIAGNKYDLAISAVSERTGVLSSKPSVLGDVRKAHTLTESDLEIIDGSIFLKWKIERLTEAEKTTLQARATEEQIEASTRLFDKIIDDGNLFKILEMIDLLKNNKPYDNHTIAEKILYTPIVSPVTFRLADIDKAKVELTFKKQNVSENSVTVNCIDILQRFDTLVINQGTNGKYIDVLKMIRTDWAVSYPELNARYNILLSLLVNSKYFNGVANESILFDEIGKGAGETIDAEVYSVYAKQLGQSDLNLLQGDESRVKESAEVLLSPALETAKIDTFNGDVGNQKVLYSTYYIKFKPVFNKSGERKENYKLVLKQDSLYFENFVCNIDYESASDKWIISNGVKEFELNYEDGYIWIPLSSRNSENGLDKIIDVKTIKYRASIYACGNITEINGKSDIISVTYLGFNKDSINVNRGRLSWTPYDYQGVNYETKIIYKRASDGFYSVQDLPYLTNTSDNILNTIGVYDSVCLMISGKISDFAVSVDSEVVMIENVARLNAPELSVYDGYIKITDPNSYTDQDGYVRNYKISNDVSEGKFLTTGECDSTINYQAGVLVGTASDEYRMTELNASKFNISNIGSTGVLNFVRKETHARLGDVSVYALDDSKNLFLISSTSEIEAKVLNSTQINVNDEGDFSWNPVANASDNVKVIPDDQRIVYQVEVITYIESSIGTETIYNELQRDYYYTDQTTISSDIIDTEDSKLRYKVSVSAMAFKLSGSESDVITTIFGQKFYKQTNANYKNSTLKILRSGKISQEEMKAKLSSPVDIDVIASGSDCGNIIFTHEGGANVKYIAYASTSKDFNSAIRVSGTFRRISENQIVFKPAESLNPSAQYYYWMKAGTTDKSMFASKNVCSAEKYYQLPTITDQDFVIRSYGGVYALDLTPYKSNSGINVISGTKNYYDIKVSLQSSGSGQKFFMIDPYDEAKSIIYIITNDSTDYDVNYSYYVSSGRSITMNSQVLLKEDLGIKTINSLESDEFVFKQVKWSDLDEITYDKDNYSFNWTYGKRYIINASENQPLYELVDGNYVLSDKELTESDSYRIIQKGEDFTRITINGNEQDYYYIESEKVETEEDDENVTFEVEITAEQIVSEDSQKTTYKETKRKYTNITSRSFTPDFIGEITSFKVSVKGGKNDLQSDPISYPINSNNKVNINIFKCGDGTEENPFEIASSEHLNNLSFKLERDQQMQRYEEVVCRIVRYKSGAVDKTTISRRVGDDAVTLDGKYYFKQTSDITISFEGVLLDDFKGKYNGNNFVINIIGSGTEDINQYVGYKTISTNYNGVFALFKNISSGAEIGNIKLNIDYNYAAQDKNIIVSGLVFNNGGRITDVSVESFDIRFEEAIPMEKTVALSGIVGVNKGNITNCQNKAEIEIENTFQRQESSQIILGGIAFVNSDGYIFKCSNQGAVSVETDAQNMSVVVAGVIALNFGGTVDLCFNEGDISVSNRSTTQVAGISCYSGQGATSVGESTNAGTMKYCWNSGSLNGNSRSVAGIIYSLNRTKLDNIITCGSINEDINSRNLFFVEATLGENSNCYAPGGFSDTFGLSGVSAISTTQDLIISHPSELIRVSFDGLEYNVAVE